MVSSVTALNSSKLPRTFAAFQHPAYRIIWPANFCSLLSRWMQMTLLGWMVLTLTDSAWRVSLVGFFSLAPMLFVGLVSGVLADRFDRLKLLRVTQVVGFAAAIGMAAVLVLGKEEFWHAYVTITLVGSAWALELPTRRSMIHDLVGSSGVTNAVALDSIGMNASAMVGPALAGVLISQVDVVGGYVVVVGFSVVSMVMVWTLRLDIGRRASAAKRRMTLDLLVGLRYTLRHPTLLGCCSDYHRHERAVLPVPLPHTRDCTRRSWSRTRPDGPDGLDRRAWRVGGGDSDRLVHQRPAAWPYLYRRLGWWRRSA